MTPPPGLVLTGLSDEEDAARFIALSFNPDLLFCPNCEVHQSRGMWEYDQCTRCGMTLAPKDTPPLRRKHT